MGIREGVKKLFRERFSDKIQRALKTPFYSNNFFFSVNPSLRTGSIEKLTKGEKKENDFCPLSEMSGGGGRSVGDIYPKKSSFFTPFLR